MITVNNLAFHYKGHPVLKDISFKARKGEILSILGPNGTGKTTLLNCLLNINVPDKGSISIDDKNIRDYSIRELAQTIAYVPQSFDSVGFNSISVFQNILMGRTPFIEGEYTKEDRKKVFEILQSMGLQELAFKPLNQISGGERQRTYIARAIAQDPQIILLDEPTSSLDIQNQLNAMKIIEKLVRTENITAIMTMHDINLASLYSDTIILLKDGYVFVTGTPAEVLTVESIKAVYHIDTQITLVDGKPEILLKK